MDDYRTLINWCIFYNIRDIIKLKRFYYKQNKNNRLDLIIFDKNQRKLIHEFCEKNELLSRSEYKQSNEVYTRQCGCGAWSRDYLVNYAFECPYEHEDESSTIGCTETDFPCCNETLEELLKDKEVKLRYKPTGNMLIMRKDNVVFGYKKQAAYRKYKRNHTRIK